MKREFYVPDLMNEEIWQESGEKKQPLEMLSREIERQFVASRGAEWKKLKYN